VPYGSRIGGEHPGLVGYPELRYRSQFIDRSPNPAPSEGLIPSLSRTLGLRGIFAENAIESVCIPAIHLFDHFCEPPGIETARRPTETRPAAGPRPAGL